MESILSINGVAQVLSFVSLPVLIGTLAVSVLVVAGAAERIALLVEDASVRLSTRRDRQR